MNGIAVASAATKTAMSGVPLMKNPDLDWAIVISYTRLGRAFGW
jgi:hypothetical protein